MKTNKILKTLVLSMAMAALMLLPLMVNAQYDEDKYGIQPWFGSSLLGKESGTRGADNVTITGGIQNDDFLEVTPLGSGIASCW